MLSKDIHVFVACRNAVATWVDCWGFMGLSRSWSSFSIFHKRLMSVLLTKIFLRYESVTCWYPFDFYSLNFGRFFSFSDTLFFIIIIIIITHHHCHFHRQLYGYHHHWEKLTAFQLTKISLRCLWLFILLLFLNSQFY